MAQQGISQNNMRVNLQFINTKRGIAPNTPNTPRTSSALTRNSISTLQMATKMVMSVAQRQT